MVSAKKMLKNLGGIISGEIQRIEEAHQGGHGESFRPHPVRVGSNEFLAHDAKRVNSAMNQSGRGDYRLLKDMAENAWYLAQHRTRGNGYSVIGRVS